MPKIKIENTDKHSPDNHSPNRIIENQDLESLIEKLKQNTLSSDEMFSLLAIKNSELGTEIPNTKYSDTTHQTKDKSSINNIISTLQNNNTALKIEDNNKSALNNENKSKHQKLVSTTDNSL